MKLVLKIVVVALVGLVLLGIALALGLDRIVAEAIRRGASYATGVETELESADVSLRGGSLELEGLRVDNPPGFTDEFFLDLQHVRVALETGSLFDEAIVVDDLALDGLVANLERKEGRTNYDVILANLQSLGKPGQEPPAAEEPAGEKRSLHVKRIRLRQIQANVRLDLAGQGQSMSVRVPEVAIDDFRTDGDTKQLVAQLTRAVIEAVLGAVVEFGGDLPKELLEQLHGRLEGLSTRVQGQVQGALEKLEGATGELPGGLGEKAGQLGENAGETLEKGARKLDELLGGKKKQE